jgi:hypothetical protein
MSSIQGDQILNSFISSISRLLFSVLSEISQVSLRISHMRAKSVRRWRTVRYQAADTRVLSLVDANEEKGFDHI